MVSYYIAAVVISVSVLQGALFGLTGIYSVYSPIAIGAAIATVITGWVYLTRKDARSFRLLIGLFCIQFGYFLVSLMNADLPKSRLLQVTIVVLYGAVLTGWLGSRVLAPANAFLLSISMAASVLLAEGILEITTPDWSGFAALRWTGTVQPHPELGYHHLPHSSRKLYYPDNPRGYFKAEEDQRENVWQLQVNPRHVATLEFPPDNLERVRIVIEKTGRGNPWDIQLNQPEYTVEANQRYIVSFQARADSARQIVLAFAKAEKPWTALGLRKTIELTTAWQTHNMKSL